MKHHRRLESDHLGTDPFISKNIYGFKTSLINDSFSDCFICPREMTSSMYQFCFEIIFFRIERNLEFGFKDGFGGKLRIIEF